MKKIFLACAFGLALSALAADRAQAQGRSGSAGPGVSRQPPSVATPGSAGSRANPGQVGAGAGGVSSETGGLGVGAYGDFQGNFSHAIDETMFLRFNGAVDLEEQTGASTDADVRGTIGLGWKY